MDTRKEFEEEPSCPAVEEKKMRRP